MRERQTQMYAKLKPIVTSRSATGPGRRSKSPQTSQTTAAELLASRRANARNKLIAFETRASIDAFEASLNDRGTVEAGGEEVLPSSRSMSGEEMETSPTKGLVS